MLGQSSGGSGQSWFLYDGHGSTRALADPAGDITARYSYNAYGCSLSFQVSSLNPPATALLYSGEQFDADLQLQYLRARYYAPTIGCFNRLDPYAGNHSDPQSLHKYAYCHGDPVNGVDPSGEFTLIEILSVAAIVATLGAVAVAAYHEAATQSFVGDFQKVYQALRPVAISAAYSGRCSRNDALSEARSIAWAYVNTFYRFRGYPKELHHVHHGHLCYAWASLMWNALSPLGRREPVSNPCGGGRCLYVSWVTHDDGDIVAHNWVRVSAEKPGLTTGPDNTDAVNLDPWMDFGPRAYTESTGLHNWTSYVQWGSAGEVLGLVSWEGTGWAVYDDGAWLTTIRRLRSKVAPEILIWEYETGM